MLFHVTDSRSIRICLCSPRGHNWENAARAGTGEMKGRKAFWAAESGRHKNPGLILTFLRVWESRCVILLVVMVLLGNLNFKLPANLYSVCRRRAIYHFYEATKSPH